MRIRGESKLFMSRSGGAKNIFDCCWGLFSHWPRDGRSEDYWIMISKVAQVLTKHCQGSQKTPFSNLNGFLWIGFSLFFESRRHQNKWFLRWYCPVAGSFIDSGWLYASTFCALLRLFGEKKNSFYFVAKRHLKWSKWKNWGASNWLILLQHIQAQPSSFIHSLPMTWSKSRVISSDSWDASSLLRSHLDGWVEKLKSRPNLYISERTNDQSQSQIQDIAI